MAERNRLLQRIEEGLIRILIGPQTKGVVQYALRDENEPGLTHLLVITEEGEEKYLRWDTKKCPWKPGDDIEVWTRATGHLLMPWNKAERDPFNLKPRKRE
jgi:hypothetical protein